MSKDSAIKLFPALHKLQFPTLIIHRNQYIIPLYAAKEIKDAIEE